MPIVKDLREKLAVMREVVEFLWRRKLWWLIPMILLLFFLVPLVLLSQNSAIAPLIYTLF